MAREEYKCDYCGYTTVNRYGSYLCPVCRHVLKPVHPQKKRTPLQRRWWFWTLIVIIVIAIGWRYKDRIYNAVQSFPNVVGNQQVKQSTNSKPSYSLPTNAPKPNSIPTASPFSKDDCVEIDYKTLARNPEKYNDAAIKTTVVVKQTFESNGVIYYACYAYVGDQLISNLDIDKAYIVYDYREKGSDRVLVDDVIEVYGYFTGIQKVTRVPSNVEVEALVIKMMDSVLIAE